MTATPEAGRERSDVHICWTEPHTEIRRDNDGERWCFRCRKRRMFEYVVKVPTEPSYYGPMRQVVCSVCGLADGDCFPGRVREWDE